MALFLASPGQITTSRAFFYPLGTWSPQYWPNPPSAEHLIFRRLSHMLCYVHLTLLALLLLISTVVTTVRAADIQTLKVEEHQGRYSITLDVVVNAPRDTIFSTISTPAQWPHLSSVVTDAAILGELPDGGRKIRVTFEDCILIFCQTIHKYETLYSSDNDQVDTQVIAQNSDFSYAREHWRVTAQGTETRVVYRAELTPSFYIPPLIGSYIVKTKIRSFLLHVTTNLEVLASR